jgi:signal peptidase II
MKIAVLAGLLTLILDQLSKALATRRLGETPAAAPPRTRVRGVGDRGVLLGLRAGSVGWLLAWLGIAAYVLMLVILHPSFQATAPRVALGVALGGAGGNVLDRLWRGGPVDFVDLECWPAFNLADVAIVAGVFVALWTAAWL